MLHSHPPPAYHDSIASTTPGTPHRAPATISSLPLHVLYRIVSLTLDPRATPSRFSGDDEEERVRRLWALFRGLKGVDRRFYMGQLEPPIQGMPTLTHIHSSSTHPLTRSIHQHPPVSLLARIPIPPRPRDVLGPLPTHLPPIPHHLVPRPPIARDSRV